MGFGLEAAVLRNVMDELGPGAVTGLFVATDRNSPAADLFKNAGFEEVDPGRWVLRAIRESPDVPERFG